MTTTKTEQQTRTDVAADYLKKKFRPKGPWVLTAITPDGPTVTRTFTDVTAAQQFIIEHNAERKRGLYYAANITEGVLYSKAKKTEIVVIEYLFVDADPQPGETPAQFKKRMLAQIAHFEPKPTFIIDSGNGLQFLWKLKVLVEVTGPDVITDIEARNWALALRLGADPSTRNIDRILRLPGTINYPNAKKRKDGRVACEAVLLEYNDVAYSIDDFPVHVEPTKEEHTRDESRSGKAFRYMQDCMRRRMSYEATREAILNDDGEVGEWAREYEHEPDQRQFKRAWDKATAEAGSAGPHDWDDPDCSLLDDRRGDLPEFPLDVFDNLALADWISAAAHGTSTTVDHVAVPLLGIASSLIGTARRVQASKSFTQPMTCWTATVGFSGTGKSPGLTTIRRPLDDVADDYKIKVAELRRAHELKVEQAKAARAAWKRAFDVAIDKGRPPPPKPKAADEPGAVQAAEIAVLDYFWPHARACLRQIGLNPRNADARQVLHWIKTRGLFEVGREEIRREALARRLDAEGTQGVLDFLTALDGCEKRACRPKDARRCVGR